MLIRRELVEAAKVLGDRIRTAEASAEVQSLASRAGWILPRARHTQGARRYPYLPCWCCDVVDWSSWTPCTRPLHRCRTTLSWE